MDINKVKTWEEFVELAHLVTLQEHKEYRCSTDEYCKYLNKIWYNRDVAMYLVEDMLQPIAYTVLRKDVDVLRSALTVVNIFVLPEHQGKKVINLMINKMVELTIEFGIETIVWDSFALPQEYWEKRVADFAGNTDCLTVKKVYTIDMKSPKTKVDYSNNRESALKKVGG